MTLNVQIPTSEIEALLAGVDGKAEIVNGELVIMSPTGSGPGFAGDENFFSLREYARKTRSGYAVGDGKAFVVDLPNRRSFSPDAAFYTKEIDRARLMKFYEGAPIFAVEVRSENDYGRAAESAIAMKRAEYFAAGTLVVWDVDTRGAEVVRSYHADAQNEPTIFRRGDTAHAEPAVPGWVMQVDDIFIPFLKTDDDPSAGI